MRNRNTLAIVSVVTIAFFVLISGASASTILGEDLFIDGGLGVGTDTLSTGLKVDVAGNVGAQNYCDEDGTTCYTLTELYGGGSGGADNLGNHIATQNLDMADNSIINVVDLSNGAGNVVVNDTLDVNWGANVTGNLSVVGNTAVSGTVNATQFCDATGTNCYTVAQLSGGSDNLGNHTATQSLDMANNSIVNVVDLANSAGNVVVDDTLDVNWGANITGDLSVSGHTQSAMYCDESGNNCRTVVELYSGG